MFDNVLNLQALKVVNVAPDFQNVRIDELLKGATDLFRGASRDHQLQLYCEEDLPVVKGEAELLHRVFLNLISNAIKYSPAGGLVAVAAYRTNAAVIISVADEGIGIAKPVQDRIFESFFRVDNTDSRRTSGTGLGLALVREAVSQHGGRVWVESEEGKGSTFFVSLPASGSEGHIF
jgi:signal transduction histidine kinase